MLLRRIVNASPIIYLHHVNLLEELNESGVTVVVPDVVLVELCGLRPDDPAAVAVRSASWIQITTGPSVPASVQSFRLDPGEAAVLALALAPSQGETEVILDDLAARRCAATLGLRVRSTLSFLLVAKAEGRIPSVRPLLEDLHQSGMRLSRDLIQHILQLAGE